MRVHHRNHGLLLVVNHSKHRWFNQNLSWLPSLFIYSYASLCSMLEISIRKYFSLLTSRHPHAFTWPDTWTPYVDCNRVRSISPREYCVYFTEQHSLNYMAFFKYLFFKSFYQNINGTDTTKQPILVLHWIQFVILCLPIYTFAYFSVNRSCDQTHGKTMRVIVRGDERNQSRRRFMALHLNIFNANYWLKR